MTGEPVPSGREAARAVASLHRVHLPAALTNVLHLGRCRCGWSFGYDASSTARAVDAAQAHVEDVLLQALAGLDEDGEPLEIER